MRRAKADLTIAAVRTALTIAGSDPTGGAGLQQDLQIFRSLGVHGAGVLTALTVQDTSKVHRVLPVFPNVVLEQIRVLIRDVRIHAVKLGMLASDDVARMVSLGLSELLHTKPPVPPLVIDPVLTASDGTPLLERRAWPALLDLFPSAALVTPNLPETALLAGCDVSGEEAVETAARRLVSDFGARAALVKGGHRDGPPDDLLAERDEGGVTLRWLRSPRLPGPPVHGTGCALAAAITAGLASGRPLHEAVAAGRGAVASAIGRAFEAGAGARILGLP